MKIYVLGDNIGYIELIDHMGTDQRIVDRARKCYQSQDKSEPSADLRLLERLVGSKPLHGTTMRGVVMTFDVVAPQFVVRQWTRHLVGHDTHGNDVWYCGTDSVDIGGAYDEQSFRYTDLIRFYTPPGTESQRQQWMEMNSRQLNDYECLRTNGFKKELARCALGPHVYSQFEWTCNLQAMCDWLSKRLPGGGAQSETANYAMAALRLAHDYVAPMAIQAFARDNGFTGLI